MTKRRQAGEVESARRDEAEELRSWRRTKTGGEARGGPATVVGVEAPARLMHQYSSEDGAVAVGGGGL